MKVLVTGGRNYNNGEFILESLDSLELRPSVLIHGACCHRDTGELMGADRWAQWWAISREVVYHGYPAQWSIHDLAADPARNEEMLIEERLSQEDLVVAFPGGAGTRNMIFLANKYRVPVWEPARD